MGRSGCFRRIKVSPSIHSSLIRIRNYIVSILLSDEYFEPLYLYFDGYCVPSLGKTNCNNADDRNQPPYCDPSHAAFLLDSGMLADFIDPVDVPWLPRTIQADALSSISNTRIFSTTPLTFLAYCNLTSMLGIKFSIRLNDVTQCLTCHRSNENCECITYKFTYIQSLKCLCSANVIGKSCSCNGVPAMIRDLDELSAILDHICHFIIGTPIGKRGDLLQMRELFPKSRVLVKHDGWRQANRNGYIRSGKSHVAAWDFRPP